MRPQTIRAAALGGLAAVLIAGPLAAAPHQDYEAEGAASWYGDQFHGRRTANGEVFDMHAISAAHPSLPLGSMVEVTNLENGRTLQVRVNDRGPFKGERIIDLSRRAAEDLGFRGKGLARVRVRALGPGLRGTQPMLVLAKADIPNEAVVGRTVDEASAPPPAAAPAAAAPAGEVAYVIQAGVFAKPANATRAIATLSKIGDTTSTPFELRGVTVHKVVVGGWASKAAAQAALAQVAAAGFSDARVVSAS